MKIVKKGNPTLKETEKTCYACGCVFTYIFADVKHDRDGSYVICPQDGCKSINSVNSI